MKMKLTPPVIAIIASLFAAYAQATEYHATDLVSFTNCMKIASSSDSSVIYLAENTYDLTGVVMDPTHTSYHFYDKTIRLRGEPGTSREKVIIKAGTGKRHFGGNKTFMELTGLTLEGPDTGTGGGIVYDNTDDTGLALTNCIFRKNSASSDCGFVVLNTRGAQYVTKPRFAHNCIFDSNSAGRNYGVGKCPHMVFTDCIFTNNTSVGDYATLTGGKLFKNCTFVGNRAGGTTAVFVSCGENGIFDNCQFEHNYAATGPAIFQWTDGSHISLFVTNCTFQENSCKGRLLVSPSSKSIVRFVDSTFVSNVSTNEIFFNGPGSFTRCTFRSNTCGGNQLMNYVTLVNCLLVGNSATRSSNNSAFLTGATVRNCTLDSNVMKGGSYRGILNTSSVAVNTVFIDNSPNIYRNTSDPNGSKFLMTNCVWNVQSATNQYMTAWLKECSVNGRLIPTEKMKFSPECAYLPLYGSPLRDTGYYDETYLSSVGDKDRAGNARVMFKGIDVGCYECQKMPGFLLLVR